TAPTPTQRAPLPFLFLFPFSFFLRTVRLNPTVQRQPLLLPFFLFPFSFFLALSASAQSTAPTPRPHNLILIVCDDLNAELGCFGNKVVKTPNIDRLAGRGVCFVRNYCQLPACNPSRASLMSGLTPEACGVMGMAEDYQPAASDPPFLHRLFQSTGYETVCIGKVFHGNHTPAMQKIDPKLALRGTDDPGGWTRALDHAPEPASAKPAYRQQHGEAGLGEVLEWKAVPATRGSKQEMYDVVAAREACKQLDLSRASGKPLFLAVGFRKPHLPWFVPQQYFDRYKLADIVLPKQSPPGAPGVPEAALGSSSGDRPKTDAEARETLRGYCACVSFVDDQVGTLLEAMDRLDLWQNTTVVLIGDNGFHLGEHGLWGKSTLFDESARVPLIVAGAGVAARGKTCLRTVEVLDIYPTLAQLATRPLHPKLMGRSLVPLLQDPAAPWDRPAYTVLERGKLIGRSIRTERYRYTEWDHGNKGTELYDHDADPDEFHNLASDPKAAAVIRQLKAQLASRQAPIRILDTSLRGMLRRNTAAVASGVTVVLVLASVLVIRRVRRRKRATGRQVVVPGS
ncbi:MAG: sulfatase, partial [Tepidisphaerales bacterium]